MTYCYIHHCTHNTHHFLLLSLPPEPRNKMSLRAPTYLKVVQSMISLISLILIWPNKMINQSSNFKLLKCCNGPLWLAADNKRP